MKSARTLKHRRTRWLRWESLGTLSLPSFRYLLLGNMFSQMARESRLMAQAWLILELTDSDFWVGAVVGIPAIAAAVMALVSGVLADRLDRRRMLIVIQAALAVIALLTALLVSANFVRIWYLLALAFAVSLFNVSSITASQTIIMDTVPRSRLFGANGLYSATGNLAIVIGPTLAGLIIARVGIEYAFYFSAALFLLAALAVTRIQVGDQRAKRVETSIWHDLREGMTYVVHTPVLRWILILGLSVVAIGVWFALVPRYAKDVLDVGAGGYGTILSARGVGGLIGMATLIAAGNVRGLGRVLLLCAVIFAALVIVFALSTVLWVAVIAGLGLGVVFIWWPATLRTALQYSATDQMRGRVMGLFSLMGQILTLGWLVGGVLSNLVGPQLAMVLVALFCVGINVWAYLRSEPLRTL